MSFRLFRRIGLLPGVSLNLSKSGPSISLGPRGLKWTIGASGSRATVGIPGTGLSYTASSSRRRARRTAPAAVAAPSPDERLTLDDFERLRTSDDEEAFVDGYREMVRGSELAALDHFQKALHLPDAAFAAAVIALRLQRFDDAARFLGLAVEGGEKLGSLPAKYGVRPTTNLAITDEVRAEVTPSLRGALLILAEIHQREDRHAEAIACLQRLHALDRADVVVRVSLAELLLDAKPDDRRALELVVELGRGVANESAVHATLMLYQARALRRLGLLDGARDVLVAALRAKKDRPPELLRALRYERALAYDAAGDARRARAEFEKLYAEAPDYEDVRARLGLG